MGNSVARADDFDCLDWNKNVPHIAVTGSSAGFVTVWDVKIKKESLTLNNMGRKAVSAVAWDPNKPTRLVTAIPYDTDPFIAVWDLRNTNAPERVLRGHDGGVLSLSWCAQDNDLLVSCGKDNRTICWNPQTGEAYGEYPVVTNWTFQTRWNSHNPSLLATASFDGKITMHPLQCTDSDPRLSSGASSQSIDDADFFNKAQSAPQGSTFSLPKAPKWLRRPCGVSFGFGGKLISFNGAQSEVHMGSKIRISTFTIDAGIRESSSEFEKAVQNKDLSGICKKQISRKLDDSEEADWRVIDALTSQDPRKELIQYLGFSATSDEAADGISKLVVNGETVDDVSSTTQANGVPASRQNRLSAFFENSVEGDSFLSDLAATKGAKINNPFQIYSGSESEPDRRITRALLMGQFDKALEVCLEEDRLSDAFMVAICGGQSCIEKAQKAYFNRKSGGPNYLRLLASVVGKNLWDIVYNADLNNWKEVMATLCTYATVEDFPDLCEALGDRLEEQVKTGESAGTTHQDASFCYLAGSKLEKVIDIWISMLEQRERFESQDTSNDSTFGIHARLLQQFVEKVTVFREATKFDDKELQATSNWKLGLLYDKYTEYADLVASYGQLDVAKRYLELLPKNYPAAEAAKERINQATQKPKAPTASKQPPAPARAFQRTAGPAGLERQANNTRPMPNPSNPYAPAAAYPTQPNPQSTPAPYKPPGYTEDSSHQQSRQPSAPPLQAQGLYQNPSLAPPPRTFTASPSIPAPSKASNMGNWNDMPESFFKPPTARRGTPSAPPSNINQSYGYPPAAAALGMPQSPAGGPPQPTSSLPPPPKGTPRTNSPLNPVTNPPSMQKPPNRPTSSVATTYAPPPQTSYQSASGQQVPRGPSPYNPPPSAAPSSNRYAPAPHSPKEASSVPRTGPPPPNPYAPQQGYSQGQPRGPSEPIKSQAMPPMSGPPRNSSGPPSMTGPLPSSSGPLSTAFGNTRSEAVPTQEGETANVTATRKHAPGDRSHIPPKSRPIFELLSTDMQRVKTRAPANFQKQVNDTEKRLNILFDHLNNEELLKDDTVDSMIELSQALQARDYEQAQSIHLELLTHKTDQCGQWMVGVKRLIAMSRATP
ncbi:protein transport protein S31 [Xanthoria calcicola]